MGLPKSSINVSAEEVNNIENKVANTKSMGFGRGELQAALEPLAKEYGLEIGKSVKSSIVRRITKRLIGEGKDAKVDSVAEALRKMGYVKGKRK